MVYTSLSACNFSPIEIPPDFPSVGRRGRAPSYEDFKQSKLQEMGGGAPVNGGRSEAGSSIPSSPAPSFGIRKAKSDPDVNKHNMTKELEVCFRPTARGQDGKFIDNKGPCDVYGIIFYYFCHFFSRCV